MWSVGHSGHPQLRIPRQTCPLKLVVKSAGYIGASKRQMVQCVVGNFIETYLLYIHLIKYMCVIYGIFQ